VRAGGGEGEWVLPLDFSSSPSLLSTSPPGLQMQTAKAVSNQQLPSIELQLCACYEDNELCVSGVLGVPCTDNLGCNICVNIQHSLSQCEYWSTLSMLNVSEQKSVPEISGLEAIKIHGCLGNWLSVLH
jgi:hypothetical protein